MPLTYHPQFVHGWAWPATPNAQHNLARLGAFRMPLQMPAGGHFDPDVRTPLSEGMSIAEMTNLCVQHGVPIVPTTLIHDSGDSAGTGYHGAHGRGRGPWLSSQAVRRYATQQCAYFAHRGVTVLAAAFGNELGYSPRQQGDWPEYLEQLGVLAQEFRAGWPSSMRLVLGCNSGHPQENGRQSLADYAIRTGLHRRFALDIHANNKPVPEVVDQIEALVARNAVPVVLEDRHDGPSNDAFHRGRSFFQAGAKWVGQFGSRNVSFDGTNPGCRWGVHPQNKPRRGTGAVWTCDGYLPHNYDELESLAAYLGSLRGTPKLVDDTDGEQPPEVPAYAEPLANLLRRTFALVPLPRPAVRTMLEDRKWLTAAERFVERA